ncbi:MAG: CcmD family protein [Flavobacteriales bacterium]
MNWLRGCISAMMLWLISIPAFAQNDLEEFFYASGKIRVVIAVAAVVLVGIFTFIWTLHRRMNKLEEESKHGQ